MVCGLWLAHTHYFCGGETAFPLLGCKRWYNAPSRAGCKGKRVHDGLNTCVGGKSQFLPTSSIVSTFWPRRDSSWFRPTTVLYRPHWGYYGNPPYRPIFCEILNLLGGLLVDESLGLGMRQCVYVPVSDEAYWTEAGWRLNKISKSKCFRLSFYFVLMKRACCFEVAVFISSAAIEQVSEVHWNYITYTTYHFKLYIHLQGWWWQCEKLKSALVKSNSQ